MTDPIQRRLADSAIVQAMVQAHAAEIADLVAALKGVVRVADRQTDEFDAARAAIAKHSKGPQ